MNRMAGVFNSESFMEQIREVSALISYNVTLAMSRQAHSRRDFDVVFVDDLRSPSGFLKDWCSEHGYTDLFYQEGEWWAFPPKGVMPVQLSAVMGKERSTP
ncbi:MAG: hypothetical protein SFY66_19750 [Oculatellaceae cyanobacterium bins.114]|nr:hypothetical protein [Oculatellaceae cyanobacterium bins.114]